MASENMLLGLINIQAEYPYIDQLHTAVESFGEIYNKDLESLNAGLRQLLFIGFSDLQKDDAANKQQVHYDPGTKQSYLIRWNRNSGIYDLTVNILSGRQETLPKDYGDRQVVGGFAVDFDQNLSPHQLFQFEEDAAKRARTGDYFKNHEDPANLNFHFARDLASGKASASANHHENTFLTDSNVGYDPHMLFSSFYLSHKAFFDYINEQFNNKFSGQNIDQVGNQFSA